MAASRPHLRRLLAATTVLALGTGGALATATSASALTDGVVTPGWSWSAVSDDGAAINDAESLFENYLGTDVDPFGFTDDAFDGFLTTIDVTLGATTLTNVADQPTLSDFEFTPGTSSWVDNGRSELTASAEVDFGDGDVLRIERTLEIEGSYARWSWEFTALGGSPGSAYEITVEGNLGSDSGTTVVDAFSNTFVTYELDGFDPIIGYQVQSLGLSYGYDIVGEDVFFNFTADAPAQVDVALLEFDPCSRDAAIEQMGGLVSTLPDSFGDTLEPVYADDCLYVAAPAPISGSANAFLPLLEQPDLADYGYLDTSSIANGLSFRVLGAPAGLSFALENDSTTGLPGIRMTGTPAAAGDVRLLFFYEDDGGTQEEPLVVTFAVTPGLAATGSPDTGVWFGAASLLLLGGAALVLGSRRRGAATR